MENNDEVLLELAEPKPEAALTTDQELFRDYILLPALKEVQTMIQVLERPLLPWLQEPIPATERMAFLVDARRYEAQLENLLRHYGYVKGV